MTRILSLIVLVVLSLVKSHAKLVFVAEVARHGSRAPVFNFNLTKHGEDNFNRTLELDSRGQRQQYLIGAELRKRYVEKVPLISGKYNNSEVYLRASNIRRCLESAESQLVGLYPPDECIMTLNEYQVKRAVPPFEIDGIEEMQEELGDKAMPGCHTLPPVYSRNIYYDYKLAIHLSLCPVFQMIANDLKHSDRYKEKQDKYTANIKPKFEKALDKSLDNFEVLEICRYIKLAKFHDIELRIDMTKEDYNACAEYTNTQMYFEVWGNELLWKIGSKRYLEHLLHSMTRIMNGTQNEKLEINIAHDTTIALILNGLGHEIHDIPDFSSVVIFELHKDDSKNEYYVNTFYNDKPLKFGSCKEYNCPFKTFESNIYKRIMPGDIDLLCGDIEYFKKIEDVMLH